VELAGNFMECRILLTGAELDLFTLLAPAPLSAEEIAKKLGANLRALTILLNALAAIGLLLIKEGRYQTEPSAVRLLSAHDSLSVLPMVLHMSDLWQLWSNLTSVVRGEEVPEKPSALEDMDGLRAFIGAMHVVAATLAPRIVAAINPGPARFLLDIGGASGTYTLAFLNASPELKATLFDRPKVIEMARERLGLAGLLDRVALVPGDFYHDELPSGHDLAFVSAIIHQNSHKQNLRLYQNIFRALDSGGRIIIRDHIMETDRTRPRDGAVFAVNMLMATACGDTYTFEEVSHGLSKAGFVHVRLLQSGEHMDALVEGYKP
jgi:predicted O-methyltransferase YrrM